MDPVEKWKFHLARDFGDLLVRDNHEFFDERVRFEVFDGNDIFHRITVHDKFRLMGREADFSFEIPPFIEYMLEFPGVFQHGSYVFGQFGRLSFFVGFHFRVRCPVRALYDALFELFPDDLAAFVDIERER